MPKEIKPPSINPTGASHVGSTEFYQKQFETKLFKQGMHKAEKAVFIIFAIAVILFGAWTQWQQTKIMIAFNDLRAEARRSVTLVLPNDKGESVSYPLSQVMYDLTVFTDNKGTVTPVKTIVGKIIDYLENQSSMATSTPQ